MIAFVKRIQSFILVQLIVSLAVGFSWAVDRNFSTVTVSGTTTETSIYSFTVPQGLLANARGLRIVIWGTYRNASGGNRTLRVRMKYGSATILDKTSGNVSSNNATANFHAVFLMFNAGSSNTQTASMNFQRERSGTQLSPIIQDGTGNVDSTVDQTFDVTIQHSNANANISLTKHGAVAILL